MKRVAFLAVALLGCHAAPAAPMQAAATTTSAATPAPAHPGAPAYEGCATLRQVELGDVVRVSNHRLFVATALGGTIGYDLSDVDHPRALGRITTGGSSAAIFVREESAVVFSRQPSAVRVVAIGHAPFRVTSEHALEGAIRDVHAVDDVFYVLREDARSPVLSSFQLEGGHLRHRRDVRLGRGTEAFTAGTTRLLSLRANADASELTAIDIDSDPTGDAAQGPSLRIHGIPPLRVEASLDVSERYARILTCATPACRPHEGLHVTVVDLLDAAAPVILAERDLGGVDGELVAAFDDDRLYLTGNIGLAASDGTSSIRVVDFSRPASIRVSEPVVVRGSVSSFVSLGPATDRVLTIGSRGTPASALHIEIHELDVHGKAPRLRSTSELGEDFTSTLAADHPSSLAIDDAREWLSFPFSSWSERERRVANGLEILHRTPRGLERFGSAVTDEWVDRVLFIDDRAVAVSADGLTVVGMVNGRARVIYPEPAPSEGAP